MDLIDCCRSKTPVLGGVNNAKVSPEITMAYALKDLFSLRALLKRISHKTENIRFMQQPNQSLLRSDTFTPLESPLLVARMMVIPFSTNTGFNAQCQPSR
jgi:hypothetical protein